MISVEQALRALVEQAAPGTAVELGLAEARGRVLAEAVRADRDFPPTDRSAMDGFAVRAADVAAPGAELRVVGEVPAGHPVGELRVGRGEACRIYTGSIVPPGADAVVMVERTEETAGGERVRILEPPRPGQHIRARGGERRGGAAVLESGTPIGPAEIAALAAVGRTRLKVFPLPRVHVISTGDELVEPQGRPAEHQIRNSNTPMLLAQLAEMGLEGRDLGVAPDRRARLEEQLRAGLAGDLLLVTGGVSVGRYDLVRRVLDDLGMELLFHRIAVKPGKPILAGRLGGALIVGLPGNPVSCYAGFALLVVPALRRSMGLRKWNHARLPAVLAEPLHRRPGRETLHLARLEVADDRLLAHPVASEGSGDVLSLARANGFVITPADAGDQPAGQRVPALLWRDFDLR